VRVRPKMNSELLKFCEKPTKIYKDEYLLRKVEVLEESHNEQVQSEILKYFRDSQFLTQYILIQIGLRLIAIQVYTGLLVLVPL
jgi:hypothetical protein